MRLNGAARGCKVFVLFICFLPFLFCSPSSPSFLFFSFSLVEKGGGGGRNRFLFFFFFLFLIVLGRKKRDRGKERGRKLNTTLNYSCRQRRQTDPMASHICSCGAISTLLIGIPCVRGVSNVIGLCGCACGTCAHPCGFPCECCAGA